MKDREKEDKKIGVWERKRKWHVSGESYGA